MIRSNSTSFLALSCVGFIASSPAMAADPAKTVVADPTTQSQVQQRDRPGDIVVNGQRGTELESPKATAPLRDTPQTITVISDQVIRKQNLQTLRDVLQTVPGITFGAGEGGGGYGDSINLRGYSANTDITIDGIRDTAQYSRTDPFNLQQIEVYNGANSVFNGSGSVGGTINLASKVPAAETLTIAQGSVGTDRYYRGAVDSNVRVSDLIAVRLNGVYHRNDVPGRDVEKYERWGIAPSITIGIGGPTSLTLAYVHQRDDNTPLYGVPYFHNAAIGGILPGVDRSDYYGYRNLDTQEVTVDRLTATFAHDFGEGVSIRNLTRWQRVGQHSVTSAPQGTFCLASTGRQPVATSATNQQGLPCTSGTITIPAGQWLPSGPRGLVRDQENQLLANQTDLKLVSGDKSGIYNTLNIGVSALVEDYHITSGSVLRNADGSATAQLPFLSIVNPDTVYRGSINYVPTAISKATSHNVAVYAFDTLQLSELFEVNAGVRWEHQKSSFRAVPILSPAPGVTQPAAALQTPGVNTENLFSYRGGVVFHPVKTVNLYASYGNAKTPSIASVRAGCVAVAGTVVTNTCNVAPETARNYEVGVKAGLFGNRLEATAALFRNERSNFRVASNDPLLPTVQVLDGRSRVDGIALGLSGTVTRDWTIFANYTYLDSKVLQSVSDLCLRTPGVVTPTTNCGNSVANPDPQRGAPLVQTPEHSGSLFTTYRLPFGLEIGYGLTYQGSFTTYVPNLASATTLRAEDYLIHRAFLSYPVTKGLTAQLNVQNLTDEKYLTNVRNNINAAGVVTGGWAMPGDRRQAVFSLFYSF